MELNNTRYRPAAQEDADNVASLEMELFPDNCWNERTIGQQIEEGNSWVAEQGNRVVGYALIADKKDGVVDLLRLGVWAGARRQGIGRRLMEIGLARKPAVLVVWPQNPALRLYRQCGFRVVATCEGALVMRRP